ncbi:MAG: YheT family hydrolase [Planctomycetaceae bacterium]
MHESGHDSEPRLPDTVTAAVDETCRSASDTAGVQHRWSPEFSAARFLAGAHRQTLWGTMVSRATSVPGTRQRQLRLANGDQLLICDNRPLDWEAGQHVAVLLHGLAGSSESGYLRRLAGKLLVRGVRVIRLNHRGCGGGIELADEPFHAGRTEDVVATIKLVESLCPGSPISIVGFSVSGNTLLKYLGEDADALPLSLFRAVAVCPPVDLQYCVDQLALSRGGRFYSRYFCRKLYQQLQGSRLWKGNLPLVVSGKCPVRLVDFDEQFTAPASGFRSAADYYQQASCARFISKIRVHTTILAAADDPVVSVRPLQKLRLPPNVNLHLTTAGGHLGYIARPGDDPDNRWMDWRILEWLLE